MDGIAAAAACVPQVPAGKTRQAGSLRCRPCVRSALDTSGLPSDNDCLQGAYATLSLAAVLSYAV